AGGLSANPAWHEALHHYADSPASAEEHHDDGDSSDAAHEASCVVCAFALQQVDFTWVSPMTNPVLGCLEWTVGIPPCGVLLELAWPEPSGRGPPVRV
ncbi:MAG: hypothetical protein KIT22_13755, partial [Verrucomicrobiae bacterium]|nr:hypothetical protein [Verrucomicrobiae bacterium]